MSGKVQLKKIFNLQSHTILAPLLVQQDCKPEKKLLNSLSVIPIYLALLFNPQILEILHPSLILKSQRATLHSRAKTRFFFLSTFTLTNFQILSEDIKTLQTKTLSVFCCCLVLRNIGAIPNSSRCLKVSKETWSSDWWLNLRNQ